MASVANGTVSYCITRNETKISVLFASNSKRKNVNYKIDFKFSVYQAAEFKSIEHLEVATGLAPLEV